MQDSSRTTENAAQFEAMVGPFRRELLAHAYQMLGSVHDAEDAVQEAMTRAWLAWDRYDPSRASVRTWMHAIVTNICLDALVSQRRRVLPSGLVRAGGDVDQPLVPAFEVPWVQPMPTAMLDGDNSDPGAVIVRRGHVRLAFVVALQTLSARQRAVLILREVLQFSAAEVAGMLGTTSIAVNSTLQRARSAMAATGVAATAEPGLAITPVATVADDLLHRYIDAFTRADIDALRTLLVDDAVLEMPPVPLWFRGREPYLDFLARAFRMRGTDWKLVPTSANGQPAFAAYVAADGEHRAHSVQVLTVRSNGSRPTLVAGNVTFFGERLFAAFGLPGVLARDPQHIRSTVVPLRPNDSADRPSERS